MQFTVPQFIERKPKIIGPLTFRQFIFVGTAGGICIFLYFFLPTGLFVFLAVIIFGSASALAFVKIGKTPLPAVLKNLFIYVLNPKVYLWKKKINVIRNSKRRESAPKEETKESNLKIAERSHLRNLSIKIETKNKP